MSDMKGLLAVAVLILAAPQGVWADDALINAARTGDHTVAIKRIAEKADVNGTAADGATALLWAVHNNDAALVRALIAAGADVKIKNAYGATAMSEAVVNGDVGIIKTLLDAGADADSTTPEGQTALMVIARTANVEAAKALLDHGASVNAFERLENETALIWAIDQNQVDMVRLLIQRGANVNARTLVHDNDIRVTAEPRVQYNPTGGLTPILFAAREGCIECVKMLLDAGADANDQDPDGISPLLTAILNANFDLALYLMDKGADVNKWDWWGRTPLYAAVDYNTLPRGGRPDRPSLDETSSAEMIKRLLAAGANPNVQLKYYLPFRDVGADRGGDLMLSTGTTALLRAAKAGDAEAVGLLLKAGARPELAVGRAWKDNVGGITPLMAAAGLGYQINDTRGKLKTQEQAIEAIRLLLAAGVDINAQDDRGHSALHGAVFHGWNDVVRFLIENGANPDLPNKDGKTPVDAAKGQLEVFRGQAMDVNAETASVIAETRAKRLAQR